MGEYAIELFITGLVLAAFLIAVEHFDKFDPPSGPFDGFQ